VYAALYSLRAEGYWLWNIGEKMLSILFPNPFIVSGFQAHENASRVAV